jgi:hypothetical protein
MADVAQVLEGGRLVLQELNESEAVEPGSVLVSLRRWYSASSTLSVSSELIVRPGWTVIPTHSSLALLFYGTDVTHCASHRCSSC